MNRFIVVAICLFISNIMIGCKPKSIDEAVIEKEISGDVGQIIKKIDLDDNLRLIFYTLDAEIEKGERVKTINNVLNTAFYRGSSEQGWNYIGNSGWGDYPDENMEVYDDTISYQSDQQIKDVAVMYGRIHNQEITKVQVGNDETGYIDATLFTKDGVRYFYQVYHTSDLKWESSEPGIEGVSSRWANGFMARGLSVDGQLIVEQRGE